MNNYDQFDISDPQLDFDTEGAILANALRQAQELQKPQFQTYQGAGGVIAPWQPGSSIGNITSKLAGRMDQRGVQNDIRTLNREEGVRYDQGLTDLSQVDPAVSFDDPASMASAHNKRQAALAQLSRLPMARKMAEARMSKEGNFEDTLAQLKMKQLDNADRQAERLASARTLAEGRDANARMIAGMNNATRMTIAETRQTPVSKEEAKLIAATPKEFVKTNDFISKSAELVGDVQGLLDDRENLENVTGYLEGRDWHPTLRKGSQLAEQNINQIKSKLLVEGKRILSESGKPGSISVQEWPIFRDMVAVLDTTKNTQAFVDQLTRIQDYLQTNAERAKEGYSAIYGEPPEGQTFRDMKAEADAYRTRRVSQTKAEGGISAPAPRTQSALPNSTGQITDTPTVTKPKTMKGSAGTGDTALGKDEQGFFVYRRADGSVYSTNPNPVAEEDMSPAAPAPTMKDGKYRKGNRTFTVTNGVPAWD